MRGKTIRADPDGRVGTARDVGHHLGLAPQGRRDVTLEQACDFSLVGDLVVIDDSDGADGEPAEGDRGPLSARRPESSPAGPPHDARSRSPPR